MYVYVCGQRHAYVSVLCDKKRISSRWAIHALRAIISMNESRDSDSDTFATISVRYLRVNALAADRPLAYREIERMTKARSGL